MKNNIGKITTISVSVSIVLGLSIFNLLGPNISAAFSYLITFLASSTIYQFLFWALCKAFSNIEILLKTILGSMYLQGYWTYSYDINGEKRYGAWIITQTYDSIKIIGFGIDQSTGLKRSDVQSVSQLIPRNNDFEIVNARTDIDSNGNFSDVYYYSKTTLHLHERKLKIGFRTYPLIMTGQTEIYGGKLSGNIHQKLRFTKYPQINSEIGIIEQVKKEIEDDKRSCSVGPNEDALKGIV